MQAQGFTALSQFQELRDAYVFSTHFPATDGISNMLLLHANLAANGKTPAVKSWLPVWCGPSVKQAHAAGIRLQLRCFNYDLLFCHATGEISPALITWTLLPFLSFLAWPADTLLIVVRHTVGKEWAFPASSARLTVDRRAVISHTVKLLPQQTVTSSWWA